jgi:hypothetical protein
MSRIEDPNGSARLREPDKYPFDWELELLAREIVLNCSGGVVPTSRATASFDLNGAINHIRRIGEAISEVIIDSPESAFSALHPLLHQQTPWQDDDSFCRVTRYAKIMQHAPLAKLVEPALGLSISDLYKIGLVVGGALSSAPQILSSIYAQTPGISPGADLAFFKLVSADVESLRQEIRMVVTPFDQHWAYTYNPLRGKPLVYDATEPGKLLGISAKLLLWRITDGLYYDIYKLSGFSKAWGDAFEIYIGDVLRAALPCSSFSIHGQKAYEICKAETHHGADWRISDTTGHVFVECKTKRLRLDSKLSSENSDLESDLKTLAQSFVQNYKNINDALNGLVPDFDAKGLPIFCVVTTLENWRIDLPELKDKVDRMIRAGIELEKMPQSFIDDYPYTLLSAQQFERYFQNVAQQGIYASFMQGNSKAGGRWQPLFLETLADLMPDIAEAAGLNQFGKLA